MPKASSEKQFNNFVKGLITEASALTFPENASINEDNFVLERTGKRVRRLGIDYETNYVFKETSISASILANGRQSIHKWDSPSGDTDVIIGIVRMYNKLWFVNLLDSNPSTNFLHGGNSLTISGLQDARIDTTVINTDLVLSSEDLENPILLVYDRTTKLISQSVINIKVRDIWGVEDGLDINKRPTTLLTTHKYNLRNQGWNTTTVTTCSAPNTDPIDCTFSVNGTYPSNADVWTLGKIADTSAVDFEKYDPATLLKNSTRNADAAKGHFIIDPFNRGASRIEESDLTAGLLVDSDSGNFATVESFSGRVFYAGINSTLTDGDDRSPAYNGFIFFSRVVTGNKHLAHCYQDSVPTDKVINDIVDTDGGTIQIPGITRIYKLVATKSSLLVFAQNGVWEIFGDTGGFKATSFQVSKITSTGMTSPGSIIEINGIMVYWALAGIFILTQDEVSGRFKADNISITTIQTFYNDIAAIAKENAVGYYEEQENRIRWLYSSDSSYAQNNYLNRYNRELVFDLTLQSFYPNTISALSSNSPYLSGYAPIPTFSQDTINNPVFADNDEVLVVSGESAVVSIETTTNRVELPLFLITKGTTFSFGTYKDTTFNDWVTADATGVDFTSFLNTGYDTMGDLMRQKQTPYIVAHFDRTEDGFTDVGGMLVADNQSACNLQAQWSWSDSTASGKWGTTNQIYRYKRLYTPSSASDTYDWGESVITTKNKLRGRGKVLSLYFSSSAGKDMRLLGWGILIEGGARP